MIWLIGFLAFIFYRTFNAGMKSDSLFYKDVMEYTTDYSKKSLVHKFDGDKLFFYGITTIVVGLSWPISLPCIGIYLLGRRFATK
jgi:hypothetical protein